MLRIISLIKVCTHFRYMTVHFNISILLPKRQKQLQQPERYFFLYSLRFFVLEETKKVLGLF